MKRGIVRRLLREEAGFTLSEMLVTIMIMIIVLFALYNVFDMSLRVFSFGNNKVEAVENARLGLERMEREVRAAYPEDRAVSKNKLLTDWTASSISFGHDLDQLSEEGYRKVDNDEIITYNVDGSAGTLERTNDGNAEPVVEFVDYTDSNNTGLSFRYYQSDGVTEVIPGLGNESDIAMVRIGLRVRIDDARQPATQTLTTDVSLRNRSGAAPPSSSPSAECSDGKDNDGDGNTDYPNDSDCDSEGDNDEANSSPTQPACSDGKDNDGDGKTDFGGSNPDPGCDSTSDNDETDIPTQPQCSDGKDNDGDGKIDDKDKGCDSTSDDDETDPPKTECSDGKDNDKDGKTDHPDDPGCSSATDDDETDPPSPPPPSNRPPTAGDDSVTTGENRTLNVPAPGVLYNDTDPDRDPLTVTQYTQPTDSRGRQRGTVKINSNGSGTFTPARNFTGTVTFTYTVSDNKGGTDTATVTVRVLSEDDDDD